VGLGVGAGAHRRLRHVRVDLLSPAVGRDVLPPRVVRAHAFQLRRGIRAVLELLGYMSSAIDSYLSTPGLALDT
jgi:hypothetical protein